MSDPFHPSSSKKQLIFLNFDINLDFSPPFFSQSKSKWNFIPLKVFSVTSPIVCFFFWDSKWTNMSPTVFIFAHAVCLCVSAVFLIPSNKCCYEELETKEKHVCFNKVATGC